MPHAPLSAVARLISAGLFLALLAPALTARADDGSDDDERAKIVSCGDNLSKPGRYKLDRDLNCNETINITSSDVRFNLKGHTITCSRPEDWQYPPEADGTPAGDLNVWVKGITVNFVDVDQPQVPIHGVKIKNGTVTNCGYGILLSDVEESTVKNMDLVDNTLLTDCCAPRGLEMVKANHNRVVHNRMNGNGNGIGVFSSDGNTISHNDFGDNFFDGLLLIESSSNTLRRNNVYGNEWGIWLEGSFANKIANNLSKENVSDGIILIGSDDNAILRNEVIDNGTGIVMLGLPQFEIPVPADNVIRMNTALDNVDGDAGEVNFFFDDVGGGEIYPAEECSNDWQRNTFDSVVGPENCVQ